MTESASRSGASAGREGVTYAYYEALANSMIEEVPEEKPDHDRAVGASDEGHRKPA